MKFNLRMGFICVYLRSSAVNLCESQCPFFLAFISRRPALHYPHGPRQHHALPLADKPAGGASHITTDSVPSCHHHKRNPQQRTRHPEPRRPLGWGLVSGRGVGGGAGGGRSAVYQPPPA
ncbi:MAG: hypothetical protein C5S33_05665, partial [ANME-2 cluster archaeon]|nr:hypothetical protein [ANME-2 cluster archaeon]